MRPEHPDSGKPRPKPTADDGFRRWEIKCPLGYRLRCNAFNANATETACAFDSLEFVAVQDLFMKETAGPVRDRFTQAPEFKVTAVAIEKLIEQTID